MYRQEFYINSLKKLEQLSAKIADHLTLGDVLTFRGNLGAGKTTFIQYLINEIEKDTEVTSPTFNLVHVYHLKKFKLWHFDLYRLKNPEEVYELGIEEALDFGVTLIEWPELIDNILPKGLEIKIEFGNEENTRIITLTSIYKWIDELKIE